MPNPESIQALIEQQKQENPVLLYMKGTPDELGCGFSALAVKCLESLECSFSYVNILEEPEIRMALRQGEWPTFPQLYVKGELIGGSDIIHDLSKSGELQQLLQPYLSGIKPHGLNSIKEEK